MFLTSFCRRLQLPKDFDVCSSAISVLASQLNPPCPSHEGTQPSLPYWISEYLLQSLASSWTESTPNQSVSETGCSCLCKTSNLTCGCCDHLRLGNAPLFTTIFYSLHHSLLFPHVLPHFEMQHLLCAWRRWLFCVLFCVAINSVVAYTAAAVLMLGG